MMGRSLRYGLAAVAAGLSAPAAAADRLRDLCPDRPGLGTPACTLDPGHFQVELGLADWTLDRQADARTDTFLLGDLLLRAGLTAHSEVQLGWTAYGRVRTRDRVSGMADRQSGTGDLTGALRENLISPDGSGTTLAVMPYASFPIGGRAIGAGDWSAGVRVPFGFALSPRASLAVTPAIEAAADADRHGRHLAFGTVVGVSDAVGDGVSATAELSITRDQDPSGHATEELAGVSAGWQPGPNVQLDLGANVGLNHESLQLYAGLTRRF